MIAGQKLKLIQLAVYSAGDTITPAQALALIASLFKEDPKTRIDPARLPELLALVTAPRPPAKRRAGRLELR